MPRGSPFTNAITAHWSDFIATAASVTRTFTWIAANETQIDAAKNMLKKIKFTYSPESFDNPKLQKYYALVEDLAFDKDVPETVKDHTSSLFHFKMLHSL